MEDIDDVFAINMNTKQQNKLKEMLDQHEEEEEELNQISSNKNEKEEDNTENNAELLLEALHQQQQLWRLFPNRVENLAADFWANNVQTSGFEDEPNVDEDWMSFSGFKKYKHNIYKNEVLDVNGMYIFKSMEDYRGVKNVERDHKNCVYLYFEHANTSDLCIEYK